MHIYSIEISCSPSRNNFNHFCWKKISNLAQNFLLAVLAAMNERFVFIFFCISKFQHQCTVCLKYGNLNNTPNVTNELFSWWSVEHFKYNFSHMSCYADVEST